MYEGNICLYCLIKWKLSLSFSLSLSLQTLNIVYYKNLIESSFKNFFKDPKATLINDNDSVIPFFCAESRSRATNHKVRTNL